MPGDLGKDDKLLRSLRRLGAEHEPDVAAILRRVDGPRRPVPVRPLTGSRAAILLPAAAVLLVSGGVVLATELAAPSSSVPVPAANSPQPVATSTGTGPPPSQPPSSSTTAPGTSAGTGTPAGTGTSAAPTGTSPGAVSSRPTTTGPSPTSTAGQVPITVTPVAMSTVTLGDSGLLGWLAVGARSDLTVVESKRGRQAPEAVVDVPAAAAAVPGPFRVSWTGGWPEQSRDGASTWLGADGVAGIRLILAASAQARTVVLYLGSEDLRATLTLSGGVVAGPVALGTPESGLGAAVVTLHVPAAAASTRIQLGGAGTGPRPRVYLAAVTVAAGR